MAELRYDETAEAWRHADDATAVVRLDTLVSFELVRCDSRLWRLSHSGTPFIGRFAHADGILSLHGKFLEIVGQDDTVAGDLGTS